MSYEELAEEYLAQRLEMVRIPATRALSDMVKGELYVFNYLILHNGMARPKALAKEMHVSTARIAAILNHMEAKGYIQRIDDKSDNRKIFVKLTDKGKNEIVLKRAAVTEKVAEVLKAMGEDDAKDYIRLHGKIIEICCEK